MTIVCPAKRLAHLPGLNRMAVALVFLGLGALARVRVLERVVAKIRLRLAGVRVMEITPSPKIEPHLFHSITACVDGNYWWLPGKPSQPQSDGDVHADFNIDATLFAEALCHTGAVQ